MLTIRESLNDMRLVCETVFGDDGHQTNERTFFFIEI